MEDGDAHTAATMAARVVPWRLLSSEEMDVGRHCQCHEGTGAMATSERLGWAWLIEAGASTVTVDAPASIRGGIWGPGGTQ